MDWILENIWVLVAISAVIARLLMKRKEGDAAQRGQPARPKESEIEDPALAERTRKIREEILRKIAERRAQRAQPPLLQPLTPGPVAAERDPDFAANAAGCCPRSDASQNGAGAAGLATNEGERGGGSQAPSRFGGEIARGGTIQINGAATGCV